MRARQNFGLQILRCVIKREFAARGRLLRSAHDNKKDMFRYNRAEYVFVKQIMERVTRAEITDSRSRLSRKISKLLPAWKRERERVNENQYQGKSESAASIVYFQMQSGIFSRRDQRLCPPEKE